ncbi:MAG: hypothetical protein RMZ41_010065 [Nostoc sp. DedVER02]|uniref:hypothetical protein n=1 Tax=unclassified Nostoc TaxID=2593658 RepID=UPI002AD45B32|nr:MULTISPECIES: hypothetical protein [unclassified Nostoc]MDZ7985730.1 hypothetical protein [Nostoc sp. DedVER02]MDZ8111387.1 hypothetical protein [Nostoc sp. DedVER01b]
MLYSVTHQTLDNVGFRSSTQPTPVGCVSDSVTHQTLNNVGFRSLTQPTPE